MRNGYETQLFGAGVGDDPDFAWVRISPDDSCVLQLALKVAALGGNKNYLIGMWAGTSLMDPALFDHNDAFHIVLLAQWLFLSVSSGVVKHPNNVE